MYKLPNSKSADCVFCGQHTPNGSYVEVNDNFDIFCGQNCKRLSEQLKVASQAQKAADWITGA